MYLSTTRQGFQKSIGVPYEYGRTSPTKKLWVSNEMNGVLGHLSVHIGRTWSREPPEDSEMNEMTLPSRHRVQNSSPEAPHNSESLRVNGEETFSLFDT